MNRRNENLLEMGAATSLLSNIEEKSPMDEIDIPKEWQLLLTKKEIQKGVKKCANVINTKFCGKKVIVVSILKGAAYFFVDLTRKFTTFRHSDYHIDASSYHNLQVQGNVQCGNPIEPSKFVDRHVILLDELYDNGQTLDFVKQKIHKEAIVPLDMIYTCTAFKKEKESKYPQPDLFGIEIPELWVDGYGLDNSDGEYRNLENLYAEPKHEGVPKSDADKIFDDEEYYEKVRRKLIEQLEN